MKFRKKPVVIEAEQWRGDNESWDKIMAMKLTNWKPGEMGSNTFIIKTLEGIPDEKVKRIEAAMIEYAFKQVADYKNREIKNVFLYSFKYFPLLTWDNIIWFLRKISFKMAKRQAQTRANIENRKCYVIRKSLIGYEILSTLDIDINKKIRVLDKDVNAKKLHEVADFVAYPEIFKSRTN